MVRFPAEIQTRNLLKNIYSTTTIGGGSYLRIGFSVVRKFITQNEMLLYERNKFMSLLH
jgi:hypothetical protein